MRYEDELPVYIKREYNIVYFLLKEMDVVYVGKSTVGLARAFSHNDMDYDCVSYIPCSSKEETDDCESYYIMKYRPKYNKSPGAYNYSLSKVQKRIRETLEMNNFNAWDLKRLIKHLNITPYTINSSLYLSENDFQNIVSFIKENNLTSIAIKDGKFP